MYDVDRRRLESIIEDKGYPSNRDLEDIVKFLLNIDEQLNDVKERHEREDEIRFEELRANLRRLEMQEEFDKKLKELGWPRGTF